MEYYSCPMIEQMFLTFNGRIDTSTKPVTLCCENIEDIPRFSLAETPEETLKNFLAGRDFIIAEGKKLASSPDSHNGLLIRGGGGYNKNKPSRGEKGGKRAGGGGGGGGGGGRGGGGEQK